MKSKFCVITFTDGGLFFINYRQRSRVGYPAGMTTKTVSWTDLRASCSGRVDANRERGGQFRPAVQSPAAMQTTDSLPRVLAVLLLGLLLVWIVLGKVCRSGASCGWTVGQQPTAGEAHEVCDWFVSR